MTTEEGEAGGGGSGREAEMEDGCTEWEDGRGEKGPAEVERWREAEVNGARADFHLIIAAHIYMAAHEWSADKLYIAAHIYNRQKKYLSLNCSSE